MTGCRPHKTCPFAAAFADRHPLVTRALQARALMEDGLSEKNAFPGGVTAVDRRALVILRAGSTARQRAEDAARERDERIRRTQDAAARKP